MICSSVVVGMLSVVLLHVIMRYSGCHYVKRQYVGLGRVSVSVIILNSILVNMS